MRQTKRKTYALEDFDFKTDKKVLALDLAYHKTGVTYVDKTLKSALFNETAKLDLLNLRQTENSAENLLNFLAEFMTGKTLDIILVEFTAFAGLRGSMTLSVYAYFVIQRLKAKYPDAEIVLWSAPQWIAKLRQALGIKTLKAFKRDNKAKITYLVSQCFDVKNVSQDIIDSLGLYLAWYFTKK